jgi:hypothetical protein
MPADLSTACRDEGNVYAATKWMQHLFFGDQKFEKSDVTHAHYHYHHPKRAGRRAKTDLQLRASWGLCHTYVHQILLSTNS